MASGMGGGRALPKFGEWDGKNAAQAQGFTVIFEKARDEKKSGDPHNRPTPPTPNHLNTQSPPPPPHHNHKKNDDLPNSVPKKKHWFCWC